MLLAALVTTSCVDDDKLEYAFEKPASIAGYEYLADYDALKTYVNRTASPNFKLGGALAANDYNADGLVTRLANSNFDEIVAGNAMKMASCVGEKGEMDFGTVETFVSKATENGLNVYGHTLAWHAQQPKKWLERLLKDRELDIDPDALVETLVTAKDYTSTPDGPFPHYPMGCEPPIVNGAIHFVPTGDWSQFFIFPGGENSLTEGNYLCRLYMASNMSTAGVQLTVQNGWGGDAQNFTAAINVEAGRHTYALKFPGLTGSPSANYDVILKPQTADATLDFYSLKVCQVKKLNALPLTPEEKKDTLIWAMDRWIKGMMEACDGQVKAWDVVNEAISGGNPDAEGVYALQHGSEDNDKDFFWQDYLGDLDYVRTAVRLARQYGPQDVKLFINDYNLESDWDDNAKLKSLIAWIGRWEADGATKIDGIGTQMHISYFLDPQTQQNKQRALENAFRLMAATGKLIRISELDMGLVGTDGKDINTSDVTEEQHKAMAAYYTWIIKKYFEIIPAAQQWGICQWCVTDSPADSGWRPNQPVGLWDLDYYRKHTYAGFADGLSGK